MCAFSRVFLLQREGSMRVLRASMTNGRHASCTIVVRKKIDAIIGFHHTRDAKTDLGCERSGFCEARFSHKLFLSPNQVETLRVPARVHHRATPQEQLVDARNPRCLWLVVTFIAPVAYASLDAARLLLLLFCCCKKKPWTT